MVSIEARRLHAQRLAELAGLHISAGDAERFDALIVELLELRNDVADLQVLLDSVHAFPPGSKMDDLEIALRLARKAGAVLECFGITARLSDSSESLVALERPATGVGQ